ncbi:MAG: hypothetical protein ABJE47_04690 [bacterium]
MASVSWFQVPGTATIRKNGQEADGYWSLHSNQILLAGDKLYDGQVVRHEMLHALLRGGGHPRSQFLGRCAGLVDCGGICIEGSPPPEDLQAVAVPPDSLDITVEITPSRPGAQVDRGVFTVTVAARNKAQYPVVVAIPHRSDAHATSFAFDLRGPTGGWSSGAFVFDPSGQAFAAGETKRYLFDFVMGNDMALRRPPPGLYSVRGAYGQHWSQYVDFALEP